MSTEWNRMRAPNQLGQFNVCSQRFSMQHHTLRYIACGPCGGALFPIQTSPPAPGHERIQSRLPAAVPVVSIPFTCHRHAKFNGSVGEKSTMHISSWGWVNHQVRVHFWPVHEMFWAKQFWLHLLWPSVQKWITTIFWWSLWIYTGQYVCLSSYWTENILLLSAVCIMVHPTKSVFFSTEYSNRFRSSFQHKTFNWKLFITKSIWYSCHLQKIVSDWSIFVLSKHWTERSLLQTLLDEARKV